MGTKRLCEASRDALARENATVFAREEPGRLAAELLVRGFAARCARGAASVVPGHDPRRVPPGGHDGGGVRVHRLRLTGQHRRGWHEGRPIRWIGTRFRPLKPNPFT